MQKENANSSLTSPYDYYLADLFREIENAGCCVVPKPRRAKTWVATRSEEPISLQEMLEPHPAPPPPYPIIFSELPANAIQNIERAVQIYCRYFWHCHTGEVQRRSHEICEVAKEKAWQQAANEYEAILRKLEKEELKLKVAELEAKVAKGIPAIEIEPFSFTVEKELNAAVIEARGELEKGKHHLDFYLLALMQLGRLLRAIKSGESFDITAYINEIDRSLNRGHSECRKQDADKGAYKRRQLEEKQKSREFGKLGSEIKQEQYAHPKHYAQQRFMELRKLPSPQNRSSTMADAIWKELNKKCGNEIKGKCPKISTIQKVWIPEFKKKCPFTP